MTKTEKRALLLAAGNCGLSIDEYDDLHILWSHWMDGLIAGRTEEEAEKILNAEYDDWVQTLIGHPEDEPLPDYWADVDEWLDEHSN